ncbi:hypothetical protein A3860_09275 [Niastella vici]|uniref:Cyclic nucleotide-binding domain-containing protein n=1 Tax=Niastella vici TaxID=1703345 RepID=A0A1V9FHG3_9BACT|nr:DUF1569 domain-containing protein [Niastella vici]OQP57805.1 hypothetical protein A3860_09275 [Niastella vici]
MSLTNPYAKIFSCIDSIISMTDEKKHRVVNAFTLKCIPKKQVLTAEGDTAQTLYFINKGVIWLYYTKGGETLTGLTHPALGNLNTTQWGIAAWKHMDHHLRQAVNKFCPVWNKSGSNPP